MSKKAGILDSPSKKVTEKDAREYILERFEDVKRNKKIRSLVSFHATNKYMIMSHSQIQLKILGNIVASYKKNNFDEIISRYEKHLKEVLEIKPTSKTHSNVIMHIFGYFSSEFNQAEKEKFFDLLKEFKEGKITIGQILSEINPIVFRFNNTYLASQTYFLLYSDPQPGSIFQMLTKSMRKN